MSSKVIVSQAGCALFLLVAGCPFAPPPTIPPLPTNVELMNQAEQIVQQQYPNALLIEAIGSPDGGTANSADDITQWLFRFLDDTTAQPGQEGTVQLRHVNGAFTATWHVPSPLFGTIFDRLPRNMSLAQAVQKMRDAGYADAFSGVVLRKPLTFPLPEEHLYAFSLSDRFVLVGTQTGNVTEEISLLTAAVSSSNALLDQAEQIVQQQFPDSLLIEAGGAPDGATGNTAADITRWQFRFVDDINAAEPRTVLLYYGNGAFTDPYCCKPGLVGTVYDRLPRSLTLDQAVQKMRDAGHTDAFSSVVISKPLTVPIPPNAFHIFTLPDRFVFVDAVTGTVHEERYSSS